MRLTTLITLVTACAISATPTLSAQNKSTQSGKNEKKVKDDLNLEKIFPEKGLFGPSARGMEFSHDGKYAAWLYHPYKERRHGNDLYLIEIASGKVRRLTSAPVMAKFQASARKVLDERKKKFAKSKKKVDDKDGGKSKGSTKKSKEDCKTQDGIQHDKWITEKDGEDKKGLRYGGVRSFVWSPESNEMMFVSGGDIYRYATKSKKIERQTKTQERESGVHYLPNGKGYTYMRDSALYRVTFGEHFLEQLDPKFDSGQKLSDYSLSPDGKRIAFLTRKGSRYSANGRKVNIASYRKRFMSVNVVSRQVSDDPMPEVESQIYLYSLDGARDETSKLYRIFTRTIKGPRDVLYTPEWAPDSSRVTFSAFDQATSQVSILEARFPKQDSPVVEKDSKKETKKEDKPETADAKPDAKKDALAHIVDKPARPVYRFLHYGGPNTPRMIIPEYLADSRQILFVSEQSGFRHLHVLDPIYESLRQLTQGHFEVYPIDLSKDKKSVFITATKEAPWSRDLYRVNTETGEMNRMTRKDGYYDAAAVSHDGKHALATYVTYGKTRELFLLDIKRGKQTKLTDSHPKSAAQHIAFKPDFFQFDNRHGQKISGSVMRPKGMKKGDKRPLLVYVYGGPLGTRKQVVDGNYHSSSYLFQSYMTRKHGYVTCTIDPRGMSGYGAMFEKANFDQVGKPQVEDLSDAVKHLIAEGGIDPERVGIFGWSFGGFQTQMCLYTAPEIFKVGIAGAGPTEWENYNAWYSTGTIGNSRTGKPDLEKFSLLPLAKNLQGQLLLVHGMEDPNVLFQDTVRVYRELLKAGKEAQVDLFLDPTGVHSMGGDVKRLNKARKYEAYLTRTLGTAAPSKSSKQNKRLTVDASNQKKSKKKKAGKVN